tara:strand:+ start:238 stop:399 length:162 start_codon:yes stop_codon:yes gene_type:complete
MGIQINGTTDTISAVDGWDDLQTWINAGNTVIAYEKITTIEKGTPAWVASVRG